MIVFIQVIPENGKKISIMRTLAHEESINKEDYVEVYDYDKASSLVEQSDKFAIGLCSCRHEKEHIGKKLCRVPVNKCSSFGIAADYLIRHNMATEISKSEMLENIEESRELKLVLTTDNVKNNPEHMIIPLMDDTICLGCGLCSLTCNKDAIKLVKRKQRIILPEATFERVILQCLERGTLQNQLFDNPSSFSHKVLRGIIGGFLRISPVKQALMSDQLRSGFLASLKMGTKLQGRGWLSEI